MGSLQERLCEAIRARHIMTIKDLAGRTRTVEPYMVYNTRRGSRTLHCYQLSGYSESGRPTGWKNPLLSSLRSVEIQEETFAPRPEYNPHNRDMFPIVHCRV